jgi:GntR family transcriptional regulator
VRQSAQRKIRKSPAVPQGGALHGRASQGRAVVDFGRSAVARYIQLATLFRRQIEAGHWPVGRQLPTVDDLAAEYGVARATIRQALGTLADEELIASYRAKGTFVIRQPEERLWCEVETDWSGLLRASDGATIEVLETQAGRMPPQVSLERGVRHAAKYHYLRRRHWRHGAPFLIADVYIADHVFRRIPAKTWQTESSLRMLTNVPRLKIADARQTLTVGGADVETAHLLNVALNAPVARVVRTAVDDKRELVFLGDGVYRGDLVRLDIKLK